MKYPALLAAAGLLAYELVTRLVMPIVNHAINVLNF
jgi:hypothetical protein